jgi:hypothetical protein
MPSNSYSCQMLMKPECFQLILENTHKKFVENLFNVSRVVQWHEENREKRRNFANDPKKETQILVR